MSLGKIKFILKQNRIWEIYLRKKSHTRFYIQELLHDIESWKKELWKVFYKDYNGKKYPITATTAMVNDLI